MAQSKANGGKMDAPTGTPGYLSAICAALAFGAAIGLGSAMVLPGGGGPQASTMVAAVQAAPGIARETGARAAPRLLGPASATPLGDPSNPFLLPERTRQAAREVLAPVAAPQPRTDQLDLPLAETVTVLAAATPVIERISDSRPVAEPVRPRIALVLDDLGLDEKSTRRAIALPRAVTLSFLPYGRASAGLAEEALARGHEIMAHIPMEPEGDADPGPNALWVDQPAEEIASRLAAHLDRFPGAVGFNNHMGSRFTADVRALLPVMREARARGLLFLDSRTTANTLAGKVAEAAGATTVSRDVFLDHAQGADGLLAQLDELEKTARMTGSAIGIAHPHDLTLEVLDVWTRGLSAKGLELVAISAMVSRDGQADAHLLAASGL